MNTGSKIYARRKLKRIVDIKSLLMYIAKIIKAKIIAAKIMLNLRRSSMPYINGSILDKHYESIVSGLL
jgi:hypothetical protein